MDRGDDAAGILVARGLKARNIEAIEHYGGMLDLIELWGDAQYVIIVDAVRSGADPGAINIWDGQRELRHDVCCASTHALGLGNVIELARALHRLPEKLVICGIEAAHFDRGAPPSPQVLAGVEHAIDQITSNLTLDVKKSSC